jgi:hypothetical protein
MQFIPEIQLLRPGRIRSLGRGWRLAAFAASVAAAAMISMALPGTASATVAGVTSDTPVVTIYLTNAPSYCADVKDDNNTPGTTVWLYQCSQSKMDRWLEFSGLECGTGGQYICDEFVDAANYNVCLGLNAARYAILVNCGPNGAGDPADGLWIPNSGNNLRNFEWATLGDLAAPTTTPTARLYGENLSEGGWHQWSGY